MGLFFSISALIVINLFLFNFFYKERVKNVETELYKYLILLTTFGISLDITTGVMFKAGVDPSSIIYTFLSKICLVYFVLWFSIFAYYVRSISVLKKEDKKNVKKIIDLVVGFFCLLVLVLPLHFDEVNDVITPIGASCVLAYVICFFMIIYSLIIAIINRKNIKTKKLTPVYSFIVLLPINFAIQYFFPDAFLINYLLSLVVMIMHFTIENPDIRMIEQLNIAKDQAEKANSAKTDFLSNMSHEIRTPLNAIVGFSNLLLEDKNIPEDSKDEVKDIIMASENLLDIVNGILDISKIEANKLEIVDTEYDFNKLTNELIALTKGRIAEKPLEFKVNIDPTIPRVLYGDVQRIKQIAVNILTNAVKYTKEGWIELKISSVKINGICRLIISVEDTGIGIKSENIDKLFNKFERIDMEQNLTIEGTGLGLAITKKLVDLMNGKIVVQSVYGKGSKFTVSIDQKIVDNPTIKLEEEKEVKAETHVENKRVLLVDDNKINLKVAERLLSGYGVETVSVESGFECIEKIKANEEFDLILLDDMMPKMSGVETLHKLKEEVKNFKIPTIALTANALTGMKEKYLKDGFDDYLSKPINKDELNQVINKFLSND